MAFPSVSVIVPNYNHASYLRQRLDSIFNQTFQDFEVIILDDCSTDNSKEIIEEYSSRPQINHIIYNKTNSGSPFKQWAKGFDLAQGEYIWIAESDDYCALNFLEQLTTESQKHKDVVVAYSHSVKCDETNNILSQCKERPNRCYQGVKFIRRRLARYCEIGNASGTIFKKSALNEVSDKFLSYKNTGDYQFWSEICACGNVVKVGRNLNYWRQSSRSVTGNNLTKGITAQEDRRVYEDICSRHRLSGWEKYIAYAAHLQNYEHASFDNDSIRSEILSYWKDKILHNSWIDRNLLWLIGSIERHMGIII